MIKQFENRADAGRRLAKKLAQRSWVKPIVIALPRGGVPVAYEIAKQLHAPLDVLLVRKIGAPWQPELAIGAVADGAPPRVLLDSAMLDALAVSHDYVQQETARQIAEIEQRRRRYGIAVQPALLTGRCALLVDDGIATGATCRAALLALRARQPAQIVLATPVATTSAIEELRALVDDIECLLIADYFPGVGGFYSDFTQVDDTVVIDLLRRAQNVERAEQSDAIE